MTATHAKARGRRFPRLAALFGHDDARPQRFLVPVGMPGHETAMYFRPEPAAGERQWEQAEPAASPVHMCPQDGDGGIFPCCGLTPFEVPRTDRMTEDPALVTCRTSAHDTMPDDRAAMPRGYAPLNEAEPPRRHSPDIAADLTGLPLFRAAVEHRTRCQARECMCGHQAAGQAWGERMVRQGMHLTGMDASRILDAAPHLTIPAAVALSDEEAAA